MQIFTLSDFVAKIDGFLEEAKWFVDEATKNTSDNWRMKDAQYADLQAAKERIDDAIKLLV